jgi:glyoxylase-like metal-dependent hydrolase (beta-lactamase superfamily II)
VRRADLSDLGGGVHRVTQPLPWALDHVHCYAIADPDGWTIVDAGLGTPGTIERWRTALVELGSPTVRQIVVTHYHPDHNGASAGLHELTGAAVVVQGRLDHERVYPAFLDPEATVRFERYLRALGMPDDAASTSAEDERETPYRPATPTRVVEDGEVVEIAGEAFRVHHLPGHADGHIVLHGEDSGRVFGGDVLLNEITPNVGLWEDGVCPDPLAAYLASLKRLVALEPAVVYPGHRTTVHDVAARAAEIASHHDRRLEVHVQALRDGAETPWDVVGAIWGDRLGYHERRFAVAEVNAHLVRLAADGRALKIDEGRYTPPGRGASQPGRST